jgi:3',5'-cyclic AMP phosphodiesterase CpdA
MNLVLLHLSDLHLTKYTNSKAPTAVSACFRELTSPPTDIIIVITGDVTYSGRPEEYSLATTFLKELKAGILEVTNCHANVVAIPGNHDCLFPSDSTVRNLVMENIRTAKGRCDSEEMLSNV